MQKADDEIDKNFKDQLLTKKKSKIENRLLFDEIKLFYYHGY